MTSNSLMWMTKSNLLSFVIEEETTILLGTTTNMQITYKTVIIEENLSKNRMNSLRRKRVNKSALLIQY